MKGHYMLVSEIGCNGGSEVVAGLKITFYVFKCLSSIYIYFCRLSKVRKGACGPCCWWDGPTKELSYKGYTNALHLKIAWCVITRNWTFFLLFLGAKNKKCHSRLRGLMPFNYVFLQFLWIVGWVDVYTIYVHPCHNKNIQICSVIAQYCELQNDCKNKPDSFFEAALKLVLLCKKLFPIVSKGVCQKYDNYRKSDLSC